MRHIFNPKQLKIMRAAFDRAHKEVPDAAAEVIASRIIAAAGRGEMDFEHLFLIGTGKLERLPTPDTGKISQYV
ncbi:MAG: hypothetical protein K2Q28_09405 [Hyphomicrobium sp.]|nr:hypothetical protein [Hyphomicrobium sp.]